MERLLLAALLASCAAPLAAQVDGQAQAAKAAVAFVKANRSLLELTGDRVSLKNVSMGNRWGGGRDYFVTLKVSGEKVAGIPVESLILRLGLADIGHGLQVEDASDCYWRNRLPAVLTPKIGADQAAASLLSAGVQATDSSGAFVPLTKKDLGLGAELVLTPANGDEDVVPYRLAWKFELPRHGEFLYASAVTGAWLYTRDESPE